MKKLIATIFLLFSTVSFSDAYNYWSLGYQDIADFDGAKVEASFGESGGAFGHARAWIVSTEGLSVDIYTLGGGKSWEGESADFSLEGGYARGDAWAGICVGSYCATAEDSSSGYYVEAAIRGGDQDGVSYKISAGNMDLDGSASFYTVDLNYSFNENWGATLGLVSLDGESGPSLSARYSW